jgi:adenine deaminase
MERALKNVCAATGRPLEETWMMSSLNAARAIGVSSRKGSLEVGKDADLVLLDEDFNVKLTVAQGEIVFSGKKTPITDSWRWGTFESSQTLTPRQNRVKIKIFLIDEIPYLTASAIPPFESRPTDR